tara:strand:+ start:937 stop:1353 length:417 start_codon:yes stop_codon:yes gene_type:complete
MPLLTKIFELLSSFVEAVLIKPLDKVKFTLELNKYFRELYVSGEWNRNCKARTSMGKREFSHSQSAIWIASGFFIVVQNDEKLKISEVEEIAEYILLNEFFTRKLMFMGYDTLIVGGKNTERVYYKLSDYASVGELLD